MKSTLVLHKSRCLVYICHAVLKVRTRPAAKSCIETCSSFFTPKSSRPWPRTLWRCSPRPLRFAQYTSGHSKPCHCAVSCQQLRHLGSAWQSSIGWTAKSALQFSPNRVTWFRHSGQMSITEMTLCHACSDSGAEYVNSALTVTQFQGSRHPIATWMSIHISCPSCVSETQLYLLLRTKRAW